jgi:hypothetical protein
VARFARAHAGWRDGRVQLVVFPSLPVLAAVVDLFAGTAVVVGARDLFYEDRGPFTAAVSGADLRQIGWQFDISLMTAHRDLDELERHGMLRKSRGIAAATSTRLVESSDVYRLTRQAAEKEALASAALQFIEPGQYPARRRGKPAPAHGGNCHTEHAGIPPEGLVRRKGPGRVL